jgi:hypothetical protein
MGRGSGRHRPFHRMPPRFWVVPATRSSFMEVSLLGVNHPINSRTKNLVRSEKN